MPIATPAQFNQMLSTAQGAAYAYPAINCTSIITLNAAMKGFAESKSDGIIQFSTGAGQFASGLANKDAAYGCIVLAEAAHRLAEQYDVFIALNTDHCQPEKAAGFLKPLIEETAKRRARGETNLFQNHMLDASILPLEDNITICDEYLRLCAENEIVLEVEAGVVGRRRGRSRRQRGHAGGGALHHSRGHAQGLRGTARHRAVHVRGDLRKRARPLQARRGEATARGS